MPLVAVPIRTTQNDSGYWIAEVPGPTAPVLTPVQESSALNNTEKLCAGEITGKPFLASKGVSTYKNSEIALRRIRNKIFDYPEDKESQASNVLNYLKSRVLRQRKLERQLKEAIGADRGPNSGLTKAELAQSGTCEPDWF